MSCELAHVGDVALTWGESVRWDERRQRLYFVDCATQTLYWLDDLAAQPQSLELESMPAGLVLTETGSLVACLDDGLYVIDSDAGSWELLARYPEGMHGRANDANADGFGNLVTGTLNVTPGPGAAWWFSYADGWRMIDDDIANLNGPVVLDLDEQPTLILADTPARRIYAYPYDGATGAVGDRRVFGDHAPLGGAPDGATADADEGVWSCVLGAGKIARFDAAGFDRTVDMPMANPSDVAFGGPDLDRLFVTSIALDLGEGRTPTAEAGWLMVIDELGVAGPPEARFRL